MVPPIVVLLTVPVPPVANVAVPAVTAFWPSATEPATLAVVAIPRATDSSADAVAPVPTAVAAVPVAAAALPIAVASKPEAMEPEPNAAEAVPLAVDR